VPQKLPNDREAMPANGGAPDRGSWTMVLWEEFKYRHDLIWRLLFRITAAATILAVIPFTIDELTEQRAKDWLPYLLVLGLALVLASWPLMIYEVRLFQPVDDAYRRARASALGVGPEGRPRFNFFQVVVISYPGLLAVLVAIAVAVTWSRR
jgi:hypothetical protein